MTEEEVENCLYYGDNLDILKRYIKEETIDLIYLDPPFKSQQDYNVLFAEKNGSQSASQIKAFEDTWHWDKSAAASYEEVVVSGGKIAETMEAFRKVLGSSDMLAYLSMMAPRLMELKRVLKSTGSIYLHCDPTASHYLKMLMDAIFGARNYRNEIVWKRTSSHNDSKKWGHIYDTILFYAGDGFTWNPVFLPHDEDYVDNFYRYSDERGQYRLDHIIRSATMGPRPNLAYEYKSYTPEWGWRVVKEKLEKLDDEGRLEWSRSGRPYLKRYLHEQKGTAASALWTDIPPISPQAAERLGYPTQKPEALLERIIRASSNEGDLILDPFCGCGTTVSVAQRLNRRWIGIDITHLAITLMRHRLKDAFGGDVHCKVIGEPVSLPDAESLAKQDPYQFQWWALGLVGARPVEQKKGADKGIDGKLYFFVEKGRTEQIIFSVKAGNVTASQVRDLHGVVDREKAAMGVLISFNEPTGPMRSEAADAGFYTSEELGNAKYPRIQLLTVGELLDGKKIESPHAAYRAPGFAVRSAPKAKKEPKKRGKQSRLPEHTT